MNIFNLFKKDSQLLKSHSGTQTEEDYYKNLFIENELWNKPDPNNEERLRWEIIEKFLLFVKAKSFEDEENHLSILDLGCGRGWLTNLLSGYGTVKGIEPVQPVVQHANKIFPSLDITQGTSKNLLESGYNKKFDLIVSSEVIEHVPDNMKEEFVTDIKKLLKENGFAIITTPRKDAQTEWQKYLNPEQPIEDWMSEGELESLFAKVGFEKQLLERYSISPQQGAPMIEIYQLWLFKCV